MNVNLAKPVTQGTTEFFAYARERHAVYLRRKAGQPWPWTDDEIIRDNKFTNVYRELDKTTVWFRRHVRDRLRDDPMVLPATVIFRWFNRISTGEALFSQERLGGGTAFEAFVVDGFHNTDILRQAIVSYCGRGPYVTGAYTINTLSAGLGKSKLDGVLNLIGQWFDAHDWQNAVINMMEPEDPWTLEQFCAWCRSPCLGEFMTYEIACDLRHTTILSRADDVNTWANLGPGARRGLNRIFRPDVKPDAAIKLPMALEEMRQLLECSRDMIFWPQWDDTLGRYSLNQSRIGRDMGLMQSVPPDPPKWPDWEMREVEHTLCEYDKWCRVREGSGRPRGSAPRG